MGTYETILYSVLCVLLFIFGVWLGRRLERYEVYLKLLASRDPQAWTVAHLLRKGQTLADPPEDGSDHYVPTALVHRLRPRSPKLAANCPKEKTTVKSVRDTTSVPEEWKQ